MLKREYEMWIAALKRDMENSHLAIEVPGENGSNEWLEPVDDTQYSVLS